MHSLNIIILFKTWLPWVCSVSYHLPFRLQFPNVATIIIPLILFVLMHLHLKNHFTVSWRGKWTSFVVFIILIRKYCFQCKFHYSLIVTKREDNPLDLTMLKNTLIIQYIHNLLLNWYHLWACNDFKSSISNILWAMNVNF